MFPMCEKKNVHGSKGFKQSVSNGRASPALGPPMMFQRLFDFFPHEALLGILMDRVRIDELSQVLLRRS